MFQRPVSSVDHCHPYKKKKRSKNTKPNTYQPCCFGTCIETGEGSKDDSGSQGHYVQERTEKRTFWQGNNMQVFKSNRHTKRALRRYASAHVWATIQELRTMNPNRHACPSKEQTHTHTQKEKKKKLRRGQKWRERERDGEKEREGERDREPCQL